MTMATQTDWRYFDERMELRGQALSLLLKRFGGQLNSEGTPKHSPRSIYECAHDWVSQGNNTLEGLVDNYIIYYRRLSCTKI